MVKYRHPKSFSAALMRLASELGEETCARVVDRSPSLIRKWTDPDHPSQPNLLQALALDLEFVKAGLGEPPILEIYEDLLKDSLSQRQREKLNILVSALSVQGIVGDLSEAIREAIGPDSPGGEAITPAERREITAILSRLEAETDHIEDAIDEE